MKYEYETMIDIPGILKTEFGVQQFQIDNAIELRNEGGTIPFIARYRKERTGNLDENQLRDIFDRLDYLNELEDRKQTILDSIDSQGKLTEELRKKIEDCLVKTELEDLYLPYKPKKRTRAQIAREKGLKPLADYAKSCNDISSPSFDIETEAAKYLSDEKEIKSVADAIKGASDIIAEEVAETAQYRAWIREFLTTSGVYSADVKPDFPKGSTKYEAYREFEMSVRDITAHAMLALRRGEKEGFLYLELKFDEEEILTYLEMKEIQSTNQALYDFYSSSIQDGFRRLMKNSITAEVRLESKGHADEQSISVFEANLREMLLAAPAGMKPTLAIDPGFRTGCKAAVMDTTGKFIEYRQIFPTGSQMRVIEAEHYILDTIRDYKIELIAIGNGTAGRETLAFVQDTIKDLENKPIAVMVNESGASVYSASKVANEEFPDMDLTVRGAISIGRRLQDPLAELVKIDPKAIGVGQYQHDVDQKLLMKKLEETVESCVNHVGIDLNTASKQLLSYVSGITSKTAENIVAFRNENGAFKNRRELLNVPKFGKKSYELAAGFLRIRNGDNFLDNTAVHPESYHIVKQIIKDMKIDEKNITDLQKKASGIDIKKYVSEEVGELTLTDIIEELKKPGRDPREQFKYAEFAEGVNEMKDLKIGMELEGVITNVTNFGAFVDVGVHQDGLVHKSQIAYKFVDDPTKFVKTGQIVKVKVMAVDLELKRINLTMKLKGPDKPRGPKKKNYSVGDLANKFGK